VGAPLRPAYGPPLNATEPNCAYRQVVANLPGGSLAVRLKRHTGRNEIVLAALDRPDEPESLKRLRALIGEPITCARKHVRPF
jgi:hypothetical protein